MKRWLEDIFLAVVAVVAVLGMIMLAGVAMSAPLAPQTARTYEYQTGVALKQKITCTYPTEREDGTPLAQSEISEIRWYALLNVGGAWQHEVMYGAGPLCEFWMPISDMPNFDLTATAVDLSTPELESQRSPALQFRYAPAP